MKLTGPQATVVAALIAVTGIVIGAFLNPWAERLIEQPAPTSETALLPIEQFPLTLFIYDGRDEGIGGWTRLGVSYWKAIPFYEFSYAIPSDEDGYGGMAFRFSEGQNVSKYQRIEFTIQFDDHEPEHAIDLYLVDISNQRSHVRITEIGSEKNKESKLLANFSGVNLNAIKEVTFNVDNTFTTGSHDVTISGIGFWQ